ncbi:1,4-dihydroxy-2-naphthoate polyprenyltransferase [Naumannella sp. ID2617S]|uniref:1,4-dihydroxy-2-naphthoate octaprenyltransferase n=1 Tax=Enemella dayhoffiae TaxID=2016507 RepID=A0A255GUT7_9ACTN|nr:1,4-dihydroxy-2-naphthoate polyprenyltransferase [Enemella dayhoffiae]NNG21342.1 1,4-dihydroxy-2-naphthoate polyprenyltransferase [Naumannella sp. ID2617S]OYO18353.1 1,4-dihydroxy-2-naphthoate polyprenyltransferase [Enemella dayhoffiae]
MTDLADWVAGARPRTLPAALSPVLAGSGAAWFAGSFSLGMALLALVVSTALQVGVNFANDYSDGIRGTDADRVGPMRLVGSGAASPRAVKRAAFGCFGVAAVAGLALCLWSGLYWLLLVGVACVLAAWFYTGGRRPYGYLGLGEVFVFVFFGLVAVCGTTLVMVDRITWSAFWAAVAIGLLACAILVANNLRDIAGDRVAGKRTLATRLGDRGTRWFFVGLLVATGGSVVAVAATSTPWALLGLAYAPVIAPATASVLRGAVGPKLIGVLKATGLAELVAAIGLCLGLALGA